MHDVLVCKHGLTMITTRPLPSSQPPEPKEDVEQRRVQSRAGRRLAPEQVDGGIRQGDGARPRLVGPFARRREPHTTKYMPLTFLASKMVCITHANKKHTARECQNEAVDNIQSRCLTVTLAPCFLGDPPAAN